MELAVCNTEKNSLVKFIELFKSWGYRHLRNQVLEIFITLQDEMRNIQEKSLKVLNFILKNKLYSTTFFRGQV